jgi:ABC-type transport system involved in cytochrome bd biosynthesis fused ATPase/permease subunit
MLTGIANWVIGFAAALLIGLIFLGLRKLVMNWQQKEKDKRASEARIAEGQKLDSMLQGQEEWLKAKDMLS